MSFRRILLLIVVASVAGVAAYGWLQGRSEPAPPAAVEEPAVFDPADPGPEEMAAAHILVAHADSRPAYPGVTRSREEARNRALELQVMAMDGRGSFEELAREFSDDPSAPRSGGYLGILPRGRLPLELEVPLWGLAVNQIYPAAETPAGFHVLKRLPIRRAVARHILVAWEGARGASGSVTRTRAQAQIIAEEVLQQCQDDPNAFCDLAARFSDDADSRFQCGLVGVVEPSLVHPDFEAELFALKPGKISDRLVETEFGFHIISRDPDGR